MLLNTQPIEKYEAGDGARLAVHGIFSTIQGEGPFCGYPCVFIRLAGCNLQCPACDTDYTSVRDMLTHWDIANRVQMLMPYIGGLVVITGGEPFRQNITPLCDRLIFGLGCTVQVETNGTLPPPKHLHNSVHIVVSPKAGKVNHLTVARAVCFKYVLSSNSIAADGLPTLALGHSAVPHVARPPEGYKGRIYLQPMDAQDPVQNAANIKAVINSCRTHGYILQLQIHKILGVA